MFVQIATAYGSNDAVCSFCGEDFVGRYYKIEDKQYHLSCYKEHIQLKCEHCKEPISGEYNIRDSLNYHVKCFRNNILEKCDVCNNPISSDYLIDAWNNKYHKYHVKRLPNCDSCNRLVCERITNGGVKINSSRDLCNLCIKHVVDDKRTIEKMKRDVITILKNVGIKGLPTNIPIHLVSSRNKLEKLSNIRLGGDIHGYTRYKYDLLNGKKLRENYKIFILSQLHEMVFKAVLAHEMLHVYIFQNDIELPSKELEGFCNWGSELVYISYNNNFSKIKLRSMYESDDMDYGYGFREMRSLLDKKGWNGLLTYLSKQD